MARKTAGANDLKTMTPSEEVKEAEEDNGGQRCCCSCCCCCCCCRASPPEAGKDTERLEVGKRTTKNQILDLRPDFFLYENPFLAAGP